MKKLLLHVPLAVLLCLGAAAPAAAQGMTDTDRTPAAGPTVTTPGTTVPYGWADPRMNTGTSGLDGRRDNRYTDGNGFINGYSNGFNAGMTGTRGLNTGNTRLFNNDDSMMDRLDTGVRDIGNTIRRTTDNTVRTRATTNDNNNWGWLGLLGLIGLAGMFRGGERNRT